MIDFPTSLLKFIIDSPWVFAKTYAKTWPHEYIVRDQVDDALFVGLVEFIRKNGDIERFYDSKFIYFHGPDHVYWTMGDPIEETTIINRCDENQTYEYRLSDNDLPVS
jgi:hypothetical protein